LKPKKKIQISFEDLLGGPYSEPDFVKVDEIERYRRKLCLRLSKNRGQKTPPASCSQKLLNQNSFIE
jgi:hypothetical protein